jgi:hypothetical protein
MNKYCLIALPILLLAACGGESGTSGDGASSPVAGESESAKTARRLGVPVPPGGTVNGVLENVDSEIFEGTSINVSTSLKQADAVAWYVNALPKSGFQNPKIASRGPFKDVEAKSADTKITVTVMPDEEGKPTEVSITLHK